MNQENFDIPLKSGIDSFKDLFKCELLISIDNFKTPEEAVTLLNTLHYAVSKGWLVRLYQPDVPREGVLPLITNKNEQ